MINANELRIGNLVTFKWWINEVREVDSIDATFGKIEMKGHCDEFELDDIDPIPLTEEWLLRMGFSKLAGLYTIYTDACEFVFNEDHISIVVEGQWLPLNHINQVHQLQNLFFCLCGKELEVVNG